LQLTGDVTVTGGNVEGASGVLEGKAVLLDASGNPITLDGPLLINNGDTVTVLGNINAPTNGSGSFSLLASSTSPASLFFNSGTTTLGPGVSVLLGQDQPLNTVNGNGSAGTGASVVTFNGPVEGNGTLENVRATFKGPVECLMNATPLVLASTARVSFSNSVLNPTGCTIQAFNATNYVASTNTWNGNGSKLQASGPLQVVPSGGGIKNLNGPVIFGNLSGAIETTSGVDALSGFLNSIGKTGGITLASAQVFTVPGPLTTAGNNNITSGSYFDVLSGNYNQTGGTLLLDGKINLASGASLVATGGTIDGNGGIVNGSLVAGNATGGTAVNLIFGANKKTPGSLSVLDNLTLFPTASVTVPIKGTTAGSGFGQLNVTSTASMSGTLNIVRPTNVVLPIGTTIPIIQGAAVTGTFTTVNGTAINSGSHFRVVYNSNNVSLDVVAGQ